MGASPTHILASTTGAQVLVLVPEIALTPQWLARFAQRFGAAPMVWHSGLAEGARQRTWWAVAGGQPVVVVGARSSLFLPWKNLQLVVVDEEHDPSYKQEEGMCYHARDLAVMLAKGWGCPVVLASATPSLESWQNMLAGKYQHLQLPTRHGGQLPTLHLIDLRGTKLPAGEYLSTALRQAIGSTLERGEQVLLYLNRRGNAPLLLCTECGNRRDCPRCDASLVVHGDVLQCHHCGYKEGYPTACPACNAQSLRTYGPGTRGVAREVQGLFPQARLAVADSDTLSTGGKLAHLVQQLQARTLDVVVGTQMMVKGHHFPHLTCVGVVDADMGLAHGELRAAERTYQMLVQVAGRAGRAAAQGHVWVQTHSPQHPLMQALLAQDRNAFYRTELQARQEWADPPFTRQILVQVEGKHAPTVQQVAHTMAQSLVPPPGVRLLGPAPHPVYRVREVYRQRLVVKGAGPLQPLVKAWVEQTVRPSSITLRIDVDPL